MRKILHTLMLAALTALTITVLFTLPTTALEPGDIEGYLDYSDIVVYYNDLPMRSFCKNGEVLIVVEDLVHFGFTVDWIETGTGVLHVSDREQKMGVQKEFTFEYDLSAVPKSGSVPYYHSHVMTYIGNYPVKSFNIGGETCVSFDDFFNLWFGINTQLPYSPNTEKQDIPSYFFDEEKREIRVTYALLDIQKRDPVNWKVTPSAGYSAMSLNVSDYKTEDGFSILEISRNDKGKLAIDMCDIRLSGRNPGTVLDGIAVCEDQLYFLLNHDYVSTNPSNPLTQRFRDISVVSRTSAGASRFDLEYSFISEDGTEFYPERYLGYCLFYPEHAELLNNMCGNSDKHFRLYINGERVNGLMIDMGISRQKNYTERDGSYFVFYYDSLFWEEDVETVRVEINLST